MNSFYNTYSEEICPVLKSIDILIKSGKNEIEPHKISRLLNISENEIDYIAKAKNINHIASENIPIIMLNGSSYICRLFRKALSYSDISTYTPEEIAYIYSIDKSKVLKACHALHIDKITEDILPIVFKNITLT